MMAGGNRGVACLIAAAAVIMCLFTTACSSIEEAPQGNGGVGIDQQDYNAEVQAGTSTEPCWVVTSITSPDGSVTRNTYEYDDAGNKIHEVDYPGTSDEWSYAMEYDAFGNRTKTISEFEFDSETYTEESVVKNTLDANGRVILTTQEYDDGHRVEVTYDYYSDGTIKQRVLREIYKPENQGDDEYIYNMYTREAVRTLCYDSTGLLVEETKISYMYDNEFFFYDDDFDSLIQKKQVATYQWVHSGKGIINKLIRSYQSFKGDGENGFVADQEPEIQEYTIDCDDNGNITRIIEIGGFERLLALHYKRIDNPSLGAYAAARNRSEVYDIIRLI